RVAQPREADAGDAHRRRRVEGNRQVDDLVDGVGSAAFINSPKTSYILNEDAPVVVRGDDVCADAQGRAGELGAALEEGGGAAGRGRLHRPERRRPVEEGHVIRPELCSKWNAAAGWEGPAGHG